MERTPATLVSWEDIEKWCSGIASQVLSSNYRPDAVIGMARGGWVPARLVCDELGIRNLYSVRTSHWGVTATPDGRARLLGTVAGDLEERSVLIVDDITDTGESIRLAYEHVLSLKPRDLRTATMLHIDHSSFRPDYTSSVVPRDKWKWFVFPWNYIEDMSTFITKILEGEMNTAEIENQLRRRHGLKLTRRETLELLRKLERRGTLRRSGTRWSVLS